MKTAIALSDSHGNRRIFEKIDRQLLECDYIFHLGDGFSDAFWLKNRYGNKVVAVAGNCDGDTEGDRKLLEIEGVKIFLTHGHKYNVKRSLDELFNAACEIGATVCLYGHTHEKSVENYGEIRLINPGSTSLSTAPPSYCYLVFTNGRCIEKIVDII